jgi:hypothetical protein
MLILMSTHPTKESSQNSKGPWNWNVHWKNNVAHKKLIEVAKQWSQNLMVVIDQIYVTSIEIEQHENKNQDEVLSK